MTDTALATATITQAMIDAGAKALLLDWQGADTEDLFEDQVWHESYRNGARLVLEAALAAGPSAKETPAPSDLEQAIDIGDDMIADMVVMIGEYFEIDSFENIHAVAQDILGSVLIKPSRAALAAGRSAGEGTSDE